MVTPALRRFGGAVLLVGLLHGSVAEAADPSPAARETARSLMDRGYERMKKNDAKAALEDFKGADAIMNVTSTGLAVGQALEKLGRLVEARDKYLEVARLPSKPGESAQIRDARTQADKLQGKVAERIPSIKFELSGLPASVLPTVSVDGEAVLASTLTLPRKVDPGKHVVSGNAEGFKEARVELELAEHEQKAAVLAFVPLPKEAPKVIVKHPPPPLPPPAPPVKQGFSAFFWAGIGVTAAGIGAGTVTGVMSLGLASDAKANCTGNVCPESEASTIDKSLLLAHISTGSFALGGVGLGLLGYGLYDSGVFGGKADAKAAFKVEPVVGPGSFTLRGSF